MKKYILFLVISVISVSLFAQEPAKEKEKPVSETFASGYLIDNQTVLVPDAKTLEFIIQHKFGSIDNGWSDLFGIYAAGSNIRLGLNYVPVKNLQLGVGVTKKNMYTDVNAKYSLLKQTERSSVPVSVTLFGSAAVDGRNVSAFGTGKLHQPGEGLAQYSVGFADRMSYFSQIIVARKFTSWLSLQAGASFTHYNMVAAQYDHDLVGLHFNGRVKISPQSSIIFNYDAPLKITDISEQSTWIDKNHPTSNLCFGIEIATFTHAFQIYVGTADGILPQDNMMWNRNDWQNKGLAVGFNITRLWMF